MTLTSLSAIADLPPEALHSVMANRWFASLSKEHQSALLGATRRMALREGQHFASQSHNVRKKRDGFAVLISGLIKVSSTTASGREAILSYIHPGQWFGELAVLDGGGRERDMISQLSSEILVIEHEAMQELLRDVQLTRAIVCLLACRTRAWLSLVEDFTLRSSLSRTARRLLMLAYDDEPLGGKHRMSLDVSQDALASMLGMTRQSVASQLRELSARGAIEQAYGRVNISSMVALMSEAAAA